MRDQAAEATIATIANKAAYAGGGTAFIGGMAANEIAAYGGLAVAAVGLAVQWYFNRKRDRRETAEHEERMRALRGEPRP